MAAKVSGRHLARQCATQGLYQWLLTGSDIKAMDTELLLNKVGEKVDLGYFYELLHGVADHLDAIEERLHPLLSREIKRLDPVERSILLLGAYELIHQPQVPYRVVINEWVEIAKRFGAEQGHKFINGVLDRLSGAVREAESRPARRPS